MHRAAFPGAVRPSLRTAISLAAALAAAPLLTACGGDAPPALEVAGVSYGEEELRGLSPDRRLLLAQLTTFGRAVADSALERLGEPVVDGEEGDRAWRLLRAQEMLDSAGVDDAMLQARYRTAPEYELTVRHLLIFSDRAETDATRALAREKAAAALGRIRAGEDFGVVAAEVSEEPGAEAREGLLEPGREGAWVDEFWSAAVALEPGEVSEVTETQYGFHVLRLEAKDTVPFEEARTRVALRVAEMLGRVPVDAAEAPLPPGYSFVGADGVADPETVVTDPVSRWEGGDLNVSEFRSAAALREWSEWRRIAGGDEALAEAVAAAATRRLWAIRQAALRDIVVSEDHLTETLREWTDHAGIQAQLLGFRVGMSAGELHDAALAALGARGQNPQVARNEVRQAFGGLLALHLPELMVLEETLSDDGA